MSDKNETIVLSGTMHTPDISDAEREAVLKANAMLTLADHIDDQTLGINNRPACRLSPEEWQLITQALRHTADSDD